MTDMKNKQNMNDIKILYIMKIYKIFLSLFLVIALVACEDDKEPVYRAGHTQLQAPASQEYVLKATDSKSEVFKLTWEPVNQNVGVPVYYLQVDKKGNGFANAQNVTTSDTTEVSVITEALNSAIITGLKTEPMETAEYDFRVITQLGSAFVDKTTSNVFTLTITTYTAGVSIVPWFIIGLADGAWKNDAENIGNSLIPLYADNSNGFDGNGHGVFTYMGYFEAAKGFKIVDNGYNWANQWGQGASFGDFVYQDGGSGNITVPADGYYKITLNTQANTLNIVSVDPPSTITDYTSIELIGKFNDWMDSDKPAAEMINVPNNTHIWYVKDVNIVDGENPESAGEVKFRADNAWAVSWGGQYFPYGLSDTADNLMPEEPGHYTVFFYDLTGNYIFLKKE